MNDNTANEQESTDGPRVVTLHLACGCGAGGDERCTCMVKEIDITVEMFDESSYIGMRSAVERASDSGDGRRIADAVVQVFTDFLPSYMSQDDMDLVSKYMIKKRLTVKTVVDTIFGAQGNRQERRAAAVAASRGSRRRNNRSGGRGRQ